MGKQSPLVKLYHWEYSLVEEFLNPKESKFPYESLYKVPGYHQISFSEIGPGLTVNNKK